jgi:hypothetical protein
MQPLLKVRSLCLLRAALLVAVLGQPVAAHAHLMVAQHGTLNVVGDGAFMVLSLPVAAFPAADDDGDGRLSLAELRAHQAEVSAAVLGHVELLDGAGARPLEGLMLSLTPPDDAPSGPGEQLVVLGRFTLASADPARALTLRSTLFGREARDQTVEVTVTRGAEKQLVLLTPSQPSAALLPTAWGAFAGAARLGVAHILTGLDHLLFLLVVLAAGGGFRQVLLALTCFTLGHAATLALSILGGVAAPAALVEPAIAVTIVGMAAFDWAASLRGRALPAAWRLGLVFGCALIHGLGLASSLQALGIDRSHLLPIVAGFNLGIELGQVAVSAAAVAAATLAVRLAGARSLEWPRRAARLGSMCAGAAWFVQRVIA